ncbi:hypothetical protein F8S13_12625 [Chloroflexia bacterium SDU3-3]|nr:hypothetical protein F8S13_12625 [Chloroflexia bacterium SDU3-3]
MTRTLRELFVDRTRQIDAFQKMMDGTSPRRIMVLTAGPGMGKSWLIHTFEQLAQARSLPLALFDFADGNAYDALTLMTKGRDLLGAGGFARLAQALVDAATPHVQVDVVGAPAPAPINLSSATVGGDVTISQGNTTITGNTFNIQTSDPLIRRAIEDRITSVFFECLADLSQQQRAVFLFDSYDRLSSDDDGWAASPVNRWVVGELLARMRDGRLPNVIAVLAGRRAPSFGVEWNDVLGRISLDALSDDDVRVYLRERRGLGVITDAEMLRLSQAIGGNPSVMGIVGDNLEQANGAKATADDQW